MTASAIEEWHTSYRRGRLERVTISGEKQDVPEILNLEINYEETADFLRRLRIGLRRKDGRRDHTPSRRTKKIGGYWDFARIKQISTEVALIIASEYESAQSFVRHWSPSAIDIHTWDRGVFNLLYNIGFFELANVDLKNSELVIESKNFKILKLVGGKLSDGDVIYNLFEKLCSPKELGFGDDVLLNINSAMMEAVLNSVEHAYKENNSLSKYQHRWWITGALDFSKRLLKFVVFDRGKTIPVTLNTWDRYPAVQRVFRFLGQEAPDPKDSSRDGTAIAAAMAVGKTSTKLPNRGKGLAQIESVTQFCQESKIRIYSRCGSYEKTTRRKATHVNRNTAIGGTLTVWDVRF